MDSDFLASEVIGIYFDEQKIILGRFDQQENQSSQEKLYIPRPSTPGYITILLTQEIVKMDPGNEVGFIGFVVSTDLDSSLVEGLITIQTLEWNNVPLGIWLESRLKRTVVIGKGIGSLDAARLALERLSGNAC